MTTEHNPLTCQYCHPLPCEDYHEAAQNIHAYLRSLVNRNWAKDMAKAKAEAKKLWKVRRKESDYRVQPEQIQRRDTIGTLLLHEMQCRNAKLKRERDIQTRQAPGAQAGARRGGRANRKTHPEAK